MPKRYRKSTALFQKISQNAVRLLRRNSIGETNKEKGRYKMKMLMNVRIPHEPFNTLVREGTVGDIIRRILDDLKPESIYFTEQGGTRGAVAVIDVDDPSRIPSFAEPFFLSFNANCEFRVAMSPEDLGKASLDELGKKWS
jgi:hypothetical protein